MVGGGEVTPQQVWGSRCKNILPSSSWSSPALSRCLYKLHNTSNKWCNNKYQDNICIEVNMENFSSFDIWYLYEENMRTAQKDEGINKSEWTELMWLWPCMILACWECNPDQSLTITLSGSHWLAVKWMKPNISFLLQTQSGHQSRYKGSRVTKINPHFQNLSRLQM